MSWLQRVRGRRITIHPGAREQYNRDAAGGAVGHASGSTLVLLAVVQPAGDGRSHPDDREDSRVRQFGPE
jgi:hypothetical protein